MFALVIGFAQATASAVATIVTTQPVAAAVITGTGAIGHKVLGDGTMKSAKREAELDALYKHLGLDKEEVQKEQAEKAKKEAELDKEVEKQKKEKERAEAEANREQARKDAEKARKKA